MNDHADPQPSIRFEECADCHATSSEGEIRTIAVGTDEVATETWHTETCPRYTLERILMEEGARQVKEEEAWARAAFPAACARVCAAAAHLADDSAAAPFAAALVDLLQAQEDLQAGHGGFLRLPRWAEILEQHFPPPPK